MCTFLRHLVLFINFGLCFKSESKMLGDHEYILYLKK